VQQAGCVQAWGEENVLYVSEVRGNAAWPEAAHPDFPDSVSTLSTGDVGNVFALCTGCGTALA
jgi:hypothetical protein